MIELDIPGRGQLKLMSLVLDVNGTIAFEGNLIPGVEERLTTLKSLLNISMITADTYGKAPALAKQLDITMYKLTPGDEDNQKLRYVRQLVSEHTVSIGNGANDALMLGEAKIGICILGPEGAAAEAVTGSDVVVTDINLALDLLLNPRRLVATLRK